MVRVFEKLTDIEVILGEIVRESENSFSVHSRTKIFSKEKFGYTLVCPQVNFLTVFVIFGYPIFIFGQL